MNLLTLLNGAVYGACAAALVDETVSTVLTGAIIGVIVAIVHHHVEDRGVSFNGKDTFWSV